MDGQHLYFDSSFSAVDVEGGFVLARPALVPAGVVALPEPHAEVHALLAIVPRAYHANAQWAIPLLLETARAGGMTHLRRIAFLLAVAQHGAKFGGQLVERADGVHGGADPGDTQPDDRERFRGRGFVRVRGRAAYAAWSKRLDLPDEIVDGAALPYLIAHPDAMAGPAIAAQTAVRGMRDGIFTGVALRNYVNDKKTDYRGAARVIGTVRHAREIAETAAAFAAAIERVHDNRREARLHELTERRAQNPASCDVLADVREAVGRLAQRGEIMPAPESVIEWNGEARQGKFVQLDGRTCALHMGRGVYVRLDIQRDLNGITPPEGRNMALKRSGEVQPAVRHGSVNFWR